MSFSPRQLAAHWVPGFVFVAILFTADKQNGEHLLKFFGCDFNTGIAVVVLAAAGFVAGNFLDALRDLCDDHVLGLKDKWKFDWNFLLDLKSDEVQRIDEYYFTWYVFSANLALGLVIGGITDLSFHGRFPFWVWCVGALVILIFGQDAWRLRNCIIEETNRLLKQAGKHHGEETAT